MNWEQLQAILWLRWRLTRNRFAHAGTLNALVAVIMLAMLVIGSGVSGVGGFLVGALALGKEGPQVLMLILDGVLLGFLIFWVSGLMVEIQRSESIDLVKLLHLPVTLRQVFVFNYAASHVTPSILLFLPGMLGLCAGLTLSSGPAMVLLAPLVLGLVFMVSAWTYCFRGWLAALMVNKRRRRAIVVWMTIGVILIVQIPNVLVHWGMFNKHGRARSQQTSARSTAEAGDKPEDKLMEGVWSAATAAAEAGGKPERAVVPKEVLQAHALVPLGWLGYGAMALKQHNPWPALGATATSCLIGALGLMRAYRMTIRFYQGAEGEAPAPCAPKVKPGRRGPLLVERRLPWLPEDTAALALATFRSLLRAPELKMALIMPVFALVALGSLQFTRSSHAPSASLTGFVTTAVAGVGVFLFAPIMSNTFGLDRNGFRALVLLPTLRHRILLAKNLAFLPFVLTVALVFLALVGLFVRMTWGNFFAGVLQVPTAFLIFSLACNLVAVLTPYRLAAGTLQAKKPKPIVFLAVLVTMLTLPLLLVPLLIPPGLQLWFSLEGWMPWLPVDLVASGVLLAAMGGLYWLLLPFEGRLLQRREQTILREVTEEVE